MQPGWEEPPRQAVVITCSRCGGPLDVSGLTSVVRCPRCGNEQRVDPALLAQLRAYRERVWRRLSEEQQNEYLIQQLEAIDRAEQPLRGPRGKVLIAASLFFFWILVPLVSSFVLAWLDRTDLVLLVVLVMIPTPFLFWVAFTEVRKRFQPVSPPGVGKAAVACPRCGAKNEVAVGQTAQRCRYCGAVLVPDAELMQEAASLEDEKARMVAVRRYQKEREGRGTTLRQNATPYVVLGLSEFLFLSLATISLYVILDRGLGASTLEGFLVFFSISLALAAALAAVAWVRWNRKRRWRMAAEALGRSLGAGQPRGVQGLVDWLNTFWWGPFSLDYLTIGQYGHCVIGRLGEFPALWLVDPVLVDGSDHVFSSRNFSTPRVYLLVAARLPDEMVGRIPQWKASPAWQAVESKGFRLEPVEGGLVVELSDEALRWLRKHPQSVGSLAEIHQPVLQLLQQWGARPATMIPR